MSTPRLLKFVSQKRRTPRRDWLRTAKGAVARRQVRKKLAISWGGALDTWGGALDTAPVLREFLKNVKRSMQPAELELT